MLFLKYLFMTGGIGMMVAAVSILTYDLTLELRYRRAMAGDGTEPVPALPRIRWRTAAAFVMLAWAPILIALSIVVVPSGMAGVRVSQTQGTLAGTLYPGVHFVAPLLERVELFDTRDQLFTTGSIEDGKNSSNKAQPLNVQAKEGLTLGLAITVRYRVDPKHLDYVEANLPQPIEKEIVPPVVASAWRELVPNYTVREVFAGKREEVRSRAASIITQKLAADGIVVKEVMLRDIQLPPDTPKTRDALAEGTGERPDGCGYRNPAEAGENCGTAGRGNQGSGSEAGRRRGASARVAGQSGIGRHAVHPAPEGKADSAIEAGGRGAQGIDHQECRGGRGSQGN